MPTVVVAYDMGGDSIERQVLNAIEGVEVIHTRQLATPEARELASKADALMVTIQEVSADLIAKMERCRIISRVGTGLDAINIPAATAKGIWVTNVPDYSIDEVSSHAITMLLVQARSILQELQSVNEGTWFDAKKIPPVRRLRGQVLGLIAYGRIGQATALKARGLGLEVLAYDPYVKPETLQADGVRAVDLETLLKTADFVSLHAPLTDATHHIINAKTLALMKPTAFLINTARGPLIDENALLAAVQSGKLAGAAIDVFPTEPPPADHPFIREPRILVTPHAAWYSEQAKEDVRVKGAEEVVRVLQGGKPRTPVNQL